MEVEDEAERVVWRFKGFYGSPVEQDRKELWDLLRYLKRGNSKLWIIIEDFNEILFSYEKQGGRVREERQMSAFREVLEECELNNLGFFRQWFSWERGRLLSNNIRERLDRGVVNPEWWDLFPGYRVSHLQPSFSDHCPILVDTEGDGRLRVGEQQWQFRFNADWILQSSFEEWLSSKWNSNQ